MDPASAIGIASSAIAFLDITYKFLSTVYQIHDESKPLQFDTLEDVTKRMNTVSSELLAHPVSSEDRNDAAISSLANQSHKLTVDILRRIEKTKAKGTRNLRDALAAAVRTLCNREKIISLEQELDRCRRQLHFQLTVIQRYD